MSTFGKRLEAARKAKNITQQDLANVIGVQRQKISYIENDTPGRSFTIQEFIKVVNTLGVSADWLLNTNGTRVNISLELYQQLLKVLKTSADSINNIKDTLGGC